LHRCFHLGRLSLVGAAPRLGFAGIAATEMGCLEQPRRQHRRPGDPAGLAGQQDEDGLDDIVDERICGGAVGAATELPPRRRAHHRRMPLDERPKRRFRLGTDELGEQIRIT
jgi:hypothetical protein